MKWTSWIATLAVGSALLAGAVAVLRPQAVGVDVASVVRAPLEQKVVDDGKARIREKYTVSAPVAGTLARIELHAGDVIEPGTVLARLLPLATPLLDPASRKTAEQRLAAAQDAAEQAKASVERAVGVRDQSKVDLARSQKLSQQGGLAAADLDQALVAAHTKEAELASATFAEKVAEHQIAEARAALLRFTPGAGKSEQFEITSPVHGEVLHVLHQSEGVVSAGTALLEVGDPAALELVSDVLSQDAVQIKPGMSARIVNWGGPSPLTAKVRRVEPAAFTKTSALGVDEQRVNVLFDLDGPPASFRTLGDGFTVEIEVTLWSGPDVLQVPTSALFRQGAAWAVFAVEDGHARARRVEPGHRGPLQTEIARGLRAGDAVIIHPGADIREGVRVVAR